MTPLKEILRNKLDDLFGIDLRALAVLRIGIGLLILVDLLIRSVDLEVHYTDMGIFPRAAALQFFSFQPGWWSFYLINGSTFFAAMLFLIAGLFAVALLLGYRTRLVTFVSWTFLSSLQVRNYPLNMSADILRG